MTATDPMTIDEPRLGAILAAAATHQPEAARQIAAAIPLRGLAMLDSADGYDRVCAVQLLAQAMFNAAGDVRGAALLNRGLIDIVRPWAGAGSLWVTVMHTLITTYAMLAVDAGMGPDVCRNAPDWLGLLERLGDPGHVPALRLKQVEALANDGHYEDARAALALVPSEGLRGDLVAIRLRWNAKLDGLLKRPDEPLAPIDGEAVLRATLEHLRTAQPAAALTRLLESHAYGALEQGDFGLPAFPAVPHSLAEIEMTSRGLAGARAPLAALQAVLQGAGGSLSAGGQDKHALAVLLRAADRAAAAAEASGYWEASVHAAWLASVVLRRAGDHAASVRRLIALAARIEARRRLIAEPRLRAGLAVYLPHLPWTIAESAARAGDGAAALFGMEVAKARILGDLRLGAATACVTPERLADGLRARLADHPRTHLLTFLIDVDPAPGACGLRALLRLADGRMIDAEIAMTEASIRAAAGEIDRLVRKGPRRSRDIGTIFVGNPWRRPFDALLESLAPLVAWLAPLLAQGLLRCGDTIVYAADGSLHNIPLGMLPFAGAALIDSFALAAMPSLLLGLAPSPAPLPSDALAVLAPAPDERRRGETYAGEIERLRALLPTRVVTAIEDLPSRVSAGLLHMAAHGTFDRTAPLTRGGLALARRDGAYDESDPALTLDPEALGRLTADGVHITMRACLVGQVTQITSREALGAVWGVLSAGAASLVAASWTVSIASAASWCDHFYDAWLGRRMSRAQAHRAACLALRDSGGALSHPAHWAPFVLYIGTFAGDVL